MTADEALREMRTIPIGDAVSNVYVAEGLDKWADAIEAELKAKDAEIERLRAELAEAIVNLPYPEGP